jgi:uncharacterized damage-inducible protein DinB
MMTMIKIKIMTALNNISTTTLIENVYEKNAWHGPSLKGAIKDITQDQGIKKLDNTHTMIGLVSHLTSWQRNVINKLTGNINYKMTNSLKFPSDTNWATVNTKLENSQKDILASIKKFPEENSYDLVPSTKHAYTYHTLPHGIIYHDIYHAGQIMTIRKYFNF